jgi:peptide/nickel transport system substrate-binding protein
MLKRREFLAGLSAAVSAPAFHRSARAQNSASNVLRIIHSTNLASLDPIAMSSPGSKDYGYLTFDQLLAVDENYVARPQMAEGWSIEDGGRTYVFKLREGLKFHDGEPVRSQDCIPSIARWGARDGSGQMLMRFVDTMEAIDDRSFRIRLKRPFRLLPDVIAKSGTAECFIMPERMARTDPMKPVTDSIGSGPYRFLRDEWVPGAHASWTKFDGYIPRKEPVSDIAGGRIPAIDRVEWSIIGDSSTAMAAMQAGEQDFWDIVPPDLAPILAASPEIRIDIRAKLGGYQMLQFNNLQPPFNNVAIRRAVAMAIDQTEFQRAAVSDISLIRPCYSVYPCGTPYASETGAEILLVRNVDKARSALNEAGYNGEKVVLLGLADSEAVSAQSQFLGDLFHRIGLNVDLVMMDYATMVQRRISREPVGDGGWSAFISGWMGSDILNPAMNQMLRAGGTASGWFGWADDPALEALRDQWASALDPAEQARLATEIQIQALKTVPYVPLGAKATQSAYRRDVTGVFPATCNVYWNIGKRR